MYTEHPDFDTPREPDTMIWRYMDFTKFISLLETSSLYFARPDKLGDQYEGYVNHLTHETFKDWLSEGQFGPNFTMEDALVSVERSRDWIYRSTGISCWHMNQYESAAMWKQYLRSDEGVAIQSSIGSLIDAFSEFDEEIFIGKVTYVDYINYKIDSINYLSPLLHKRMSFEHEREVRALLWRRRDEDYSHFFDEQFSVIGGGVPIPVKLGTLVERVFIAPTAQDWLRDLVASILVRYGLNVDVVKSDLNSSPIK